LQTEYFEKRAELFLQEIPADIQGRTAEIVRRAGVDSKTRILDVGTGSGVLLHHFVAQGAAPENIIGCDLSRKMIEQARSRFPGVYFYYGDVMDLSLHDLPEGFPAHIESFDRIFFNACFANMLDRQAVLAHAALLLASGGKVVVSHPAPEFVSSLHDSDPEIVPHLLPTQDEARHWAAELGLRIEWYESTALIYLAIFTRP
ncbi:MAG: class I SAM-dependent methyltransferase, partial [Terriglobales bacterium]